MTEPTTPDTDQPAVDDGVQNEDAVRRADDAPADAATPTPDTAGEPAANDQ